MLKRFFNTCIACAMLFSATACSDDNKGDDTNYTRETINEALTASCEYIAKCKTDEKIVISECIEDEMDVIDQIDQVVDKDSDLICGKEIVEYSQCIQNTSCSEVVNYSARNSCRANLYKCAYDVYAAKEDKKTLDAVSNYMNKHYECDDIKSVSDDVKHADIVGMLYMFNRTPKCKSVDVDYFQCRSEQSCEVFSDESASLQACAEIAYGYATCREE